VTFAFFVLPDEACAATLPHRTRFSGKGVGMAVISENKVLNNTAARNKAILEHIHERAKSEGLLAQLEYFAEEVNNHGFTVTKAQVREVLTDIVNTFPDIQLEPLEVVAQGDWVMARYWFTGTHKGMAIHPYVHYGLLVGVPPTNKVMRVQHIHVFRFSNGKIVEHQATRDDVAMVQQLGLRLEVSSGEGNE
jgi:predicted ester cyclase